MSLNLELDKVLLVFSDPGGAKPCLAFSDMHPGVEFCVASDRSYPFYAAFRNKVIKTSVISVENIINSFAPNLIITGTSYTSELEKYTIKLAKKKGIKVISFVDHVTSIMDRFLDQENFLLYPDKILLFDEHARINAIKQNLNEGLLHVIENPYHLWLRNWTPSLTKSELYEVIGAELESALVLYAPDPLSNIGGKDKYNFDEYTASKRILDQISQASNSFRKNYTFLIKPHPNQSQEELILLFKHCENCIFIDSEIDLNLLLYFSKFVVSFFSNVLIEARVIGTEPLRFWCDDFTNDPALGYMREVPKCKNVVESIERFNDPL